MGILVIRIPASRAEIVPVSPREDAFQDERVVGPVIGFGRLTGAIESNSEFSVVDRRSRQLESSCRTVL